MKSKFVSIAAIALAAGAACAQSTGVMPTLNITSPTAAGGVLYVGSFPATVPVMFTVQANGIAQLKDLTQLDATVNGLSLYGGQLNPFDNVNACVAALASAGRACQTMSATSASLMVPWTVSAVGDYTIIVTARHRNAVGEDEEVVTVAQFSAEYPAPPAVANAFINAGAGGLPLSAKQRGCIISKIAEQHAKYSTYGPKGGPYHDALIHAAVGNFATICPLR